MFRSYTPFIFDDFDIMRYPHQISRFEKGKDGQLLSVTRIEDDKPVIDQLLDSSWTDVQNMISNNINIPPIGTYINSSIEDRSALLDSGLDILRNESSSEPTSESTSETTSESTSDPTPGSNV